MGDTATASATNAPLHVAKSSTDVQAIFGDNNSSIDDPSIRIIGRDSGNSAIRYMFAGLDADANHGFIGYNHGSGSFTNALNFDTSGQVGIGTTAPSAIRLSVVTPTANNIGLQVENSNTADSFGMVVKGGNDANDYTADFRKRDNTSIMRIVGDGTVGIGTGAPNGELEVNNTNSGGLGGRIVIRNGSSTSGSYCSCLLYTSPSPRDGLLSRMPSSA